MVATASHPSVITARGTTMGRNPTAQSSAPTLTTRRAPQRRISFGDRIDSANVPSAEGTMLAPANTAVSRYPDCSRMEE